MCSVYYAYINTHCASNNNIDYAVYTINYSDNTLQKVCQLERY